MPWWSVCGGWLAAGVDANEIGVAVRTRSMAQDVANRLRTPEVWVGTMHGVKGLEFRCVAVAGVNEGLMPLGKAVTDQQIDPVQCRDDLTAELCLLFVACTRARDELYVSWHGTPSRFLAPVLG